MTTVECKDCGVEFKVKDETIPLLVRNQESSYASRS